MTMVDFHKQNQNNFLKNELAPFSRPYLVLDSDIDQIKAAKKLVKILPIEQVKQLSARDKEGRRSMKKKQGISVVKEGRMKNDAKLAQI
jgi:hypothetical protein